MFKEPQTIQYVIRVLRLLDGGSVLDAKTVAYQLALADPQTPLKQAFASKVLGRLARAGLVVSSPQGYRRRQQPVTVADVLNLTMQGVELPTETKMVADLLLGAAAARTLADLFEVNDNAVAGRDS